MVNKYQRSRKKYNRPSTLETHKPISIITVFGNQKNYPSNFQRHDNNVNENSEDIKHVEVIIMTKFTFLGTLLNKQW